MEELLKSTKLLLFFFEKTSYLVTDKSNNEGTCNELLLFSNIYSRHVFSITEIFRLHSI